MRSRCSDSTVLTSCVVFLSVALTTFMGAKPRPEERVRVDKRTTTELTIVKVDGKKWKPAPAGTFVTMYVDGKPYNATTGDGGKAKIEKTIRQNVIAPLMVRLGQEVITIPRVDPPPRKKSSTKRKRK